MQSTPSGSSTVPWAGSLPIPAPTATPFPVPVPVPAPAPVPVPIPAPGVIACSASPADPSNGHLHAAAATQAAAPASPSLRSLVWAALTPLNVLYLVSVGLAGLSGWCGNLDGRCVLSVKDGLIYGAVVAAFLGFIEQNTPVEKRGWRDRMRQIFWLLGQLFQQSGPGPNCALFWCVSRGRFNRATLLRLP